MVCFHYEADASVSEVYLVGSFNDWDTKRDSMILRKTENGVNSFELYLELYSGLYYYKFFIPSQQCFIHDEMNTNRVSDPYGGYNSVLEIPIQTHLKHPLLQTAEMKADVWWNEMMNDGDHPCRKLSYDNLGVSVDENNSVRHVLSGSIINL